MFGAAALEAIAHIENDDAVAPVSEIGETILDLQIVQITTGGRDAFAFRQSDLHLAGAFDLPARNLLGIFYVGEIDDPHGAGCIVGEVDVMGIDVGTMDAAGDRGGVFGNNLWMHGVAGVEKNNSILAIGGAFAGNHADFPVGGDADIVDQAGVDLERIGGLRVGGIGNVEDVEFLADGGKISVVAPNPFLGELFVFGHGVADDFDLPGNISRSDHDAGGRGPVTGRCGDGVSAGTLRDESTVRPDICAGALHRPGNFGRNG